VFQASHTDAEASLLKRALSPGCFALDAGCGRTTRLSAHRDRISRLVGIDLDARACAENTALDDFIVADLCAPVPLDAGSFDLVYANFVVEHLERPAAAFAQWRRILKPGGALILLTTNRANPVIAASLLVGERARRAIKRAGAGVAERDVIPVRYGANTPWTLDALLRDSGFRRVQLHQVATLHRYSERAPLLAAGLRGLERGLPPQLRSTLVAWYRAV
jgi:SAM-dependent methyltransferase